MQFKSIYQSDIDEARKHVKFLLDLQKTERVEFVKTLIEKGWKSFVFDSEYYGSHTEYGEGDQCNVYLFSPEVFKTLPEFTGDFKHGSHSQDENNDLWDEWFEEVPESEFFELENEEEIDLVK